VPPGGEARALAFALALTSTLALGACGAARSASRAPTTAAHAVSTGAPDAAPAVAAPSGPRLRVRVLFEARAPTQRGTSAGSEWRAARHVEVAALDAAGRDLLIAATDETGSIELALPAGAAFVAARARIRRDGHDLAVTLDALGREVHELRIPVAGIAPAPGDPGALGSVELRARDDDRTGSGGAFHVVDTLLRGVEAVRKWTGQLLPPLFAFWSRGLSTEWSYYRGERPAGSGRFAIELMAGSPATYRSEDTDEHDEAIVLHELGHFVFDRLSTDSSMGGLHPASTLVDPGVAWEEARATWFAAAVLGSPLYRDTIGREPGGSLRVDHDLERGVPGPAGPGSEIGVAEVLWDLADGDAELPDRDGDGVALGAAAVLRAMFALREVPGAYPSLPSFLRFLVARGVVQERALVAMLDRTTQRAASLLGPAVRAYPFDLGLPGRASGKIDGVSAPAPSGGPPRPQNGYDAVHVYRIEVTRPGFLSARLTVLGTGRAADRADLDLELRSVRADLIAAARTEQAVESIGRVLQPGWYVLYVRDGGNGNRVGYDLDVRLE
jgi:hypothetical protein